MKISKININNIASFSSFSTDAELLKKTLIFGTNGAGKTTIASLLQLVDRAKKTPEDTNTIEELKAYIEQKTSKEAVSEKSEIEICFGGGREKVSYDKSTGEIKLSNKYWSPVRVFNDRYTELTIGNKVDINLKECDLIIGEPNVKLDKAQSKQHGLLKQKEKYSKKIDDIIFKAKENYRQVANSTADVSNVISEERLLDKKSKYSSNPDSIKVRQALGYSKPEDTLQEITHKSFSNIILPSDTEEVFLEPVVKPTLSKDRELLLLNYTKFYESGISAFSSTEKNVCPFCFQDWENAEEVISSYISFINSTFNQKRDFISATKNKISDLKSEIFRVNNSIQAMLPNVKKEGDKYSVDISSFREIEFDEKTAKEIDELISEKLNNMEVPVAISPKLNQLINFCEISIEAVNNVIRDIKNAISKITSKRIAANSEIAKHIMATIWEENKEFRKEYFATTEQLSLVEKEIELLEAENSKQDTIQAIFNGLIDFLGLTEYHIDKDKKLILRLTSDYDISTECGRISSAQKKLLSLCYFFAEIVSEIKKSSDLKKYILVFDDPVDSADYLYFHSITALIENIESILGLILQKSDVKVGQIIVFTHNSLLHDRLYQNFDTRKSIQKINNVTVIKKAEKTINNYKLYLEYITRYYLNPNKNKKEMIFIGNLIRRVLEILANFNDLSSNEFKKYILDIGKPKLAIISNHLSHESFSKVLNPLNCEVELQKACKELLEVIQECHPVQYEYIEKEMLSK